MTNEERKEAEEYVANADAKTPFVTCPGTIVAADDSYFKSANPVAIFVNERDAQAYCAAMALLADREAVIDTVLRRIQYAADGYTLIVDGKTGERVSGNASAALALRTLASDLRREFGKVTE